MVSDSILLSLKYDFELLSLPSVQDTLLATFNVDEIIIREARTAPEKVVLFVVVCFVKWIFEGFNPCELLQKEVEMMNKNKTSKVQSLHLIEHAT